MSTRVKLIEVALPLDAINRAAVAERNVRTGHPSGVHLWWSRKPLAACRAVLLAQLIDDPSCWPDLFPTEKDQERERQRLLALISQTVASATCSPDAHLARVEIARTIARRRRAVSQADERDEQLLNGGSSEEIVSRYLAERGPAVFDPFCGGGSIPLEARRLSLRSGGSDLNPVATMITKATAEVPQVVGGKAPVHPEGRRKTMDWVGTEGLAEDVHRYGSWLCQQVRKRVGDRYPAVTITETLLEDRPDLARYSGQALSIIGWLWSRSVPSPDPAMSGARVPLMSTYWLSRKKGKEAWVEPMVDAAGGRYELHVRRGVPNDVEGADAGTRSGRGVFRCLLSGSAIPAAHVREHGQAARLGTRLKAVVLAGDKERVYLSPTPEMERLADVPMPDDVPDTPLPQKALGFRVQRYGLVQHDHLFTARQLVTLAGFSDLIGDVHERVLEDASASLGADPGPSLEEGGRGSRAYADAVVLYLALALDKLADLNNALCSWAPDSQSISHLFGRQAIPMVWDFVEANPFSSSSGSWKQVLKTVTRSIRRLGDGPPAPPVCVQRGDAMDATTWRDGVVVSMDPPYYDNVPYADLSDFFYVWLRRSLRRYFPSLFRTLLVPKEGELVADPGRRGGRDAAQKFFMEGMTKAMRHIPRVAHPDYPAAIYYAFRQAETRNPDAASTGWEAFLEALIGSGLQVTATWPIRTETNNRLRAQGSNALASSIVLACRPRPASAPVIGRRDLSRLLEAELPPALAALQHGNIAPVDVAQAAIGPGMAVFSRHARVLEADGSTMTVRAALVMINEALDQFLAQQDGEVGADTRFALTWFATHGYEPGPYGEAETLATARNVAVQGVVAAGIVQAAAGKVRLLRRDELPDGWDPNTDPRLTIWEATQHLVKRLNASGEEAAAELLCQLGDKAAPARELAYRLYALCERNGWAQEAQVYNALVVSWPELNKLAQPAKGSAPMQERLL